jgi:hypothetical protein
MDPARGYYDKLVPGSEKQGSMSGADSGKGKNAKTDNSGVKYPKGNVVPSSRGRDGTPIKSSNDQSVPKEDKHAVKTTEKPTTYRPTTQQAVNGERFKNWRTNHHMSGWRGDSHESSREQINHDIPSWKNQDGIQKSAQKSQNNWEKEEDLSNNVEYNHFKDNSDQSMGSASNIVNTHNPQPEKSSAGVSQKQSDPVTQHNTGDEKSWNQHTESQMDYNYSGGSNKKGMNGNHGEGSKGRMSNGPPGGRSGSDRSPGGRPGSDRSPGGRPGIDRTPGGRPSSNGESRDRTSGRHQNQGKSNRWQQQQRWKDGRNKDKGQTNNRQKGQANTNNRNQEQDRTQVGSKVRTGDESHRTQSIKGHESNRPTDDSGKSLKEKQQNVEPESIDYDSYFSKSPQTEQNEGAQKPGSGRPAYKNQRPHQYQYYDNYRPSPYWNYDYYDYSDHPNKKYPSHYDQGDSGTGCCLTVACSVI